MLSAMLGKSDGHFRELLHGTIWAFLLRTVGALAGFGFNVLLARAVGVHGAGTYFLALTITAIASLVARLGLEQTVLRDVAAAYERRDGGAIVGVYRTAIGVTLAVSLALAAALAAAAPLLGALIFHQPELVRPLRIMALAMPLVSLCAVQAQAVRARKQIAAAAFLQGAGIPLGGVILLTVFGSRIDSAAAVTIVYGAASVCTLILGFSIWRFSPRHVKALPRRVSIRALLATGIPLMNVGILNLAINRIGTLALGLWASAAEIGQFGAAQRCALLTSFILVAVSAIAAPKFAALHEQGRSQELERLVKQSAFLIAVLSTPVLLVCIVFARHVMGLFGSEFAAAGTLLVILAAGQYINALTGTVSHLLMMTGLEKPMRDVTLAVTVATVVLNLVLVRPWGGVGAAVATAAGVSAQNVLFLIIVRRKLGFWALPALPRR